MGYDDCIFVKEKVGESVLNFLRIENNNTNCSMILINVKDDVALDSAYNEISSIVKDKDVAVYKTNEIFSDISSKVSIFSGLAVFFVIILEIISCIALFAIFTLSVETRKSSIEALDIIGVSNRNKAILIISEGVILTLFSALIGEIIGVLLLVIFRSTIETALGLPIIVSGRILITAIIGMGVSVVISVVANVYSAYLTFKISNKEKN
ncbi:FtsX-like permease family protein [Ruminococcus flavefaciens]|uniref:FtsX-like permease family protein n=1 Tax=Ruminococcus flavefaciens TaxID=1265 RepID=UPI00048B6F2D|nr:FtsX-like permease family protein [Ruminococcus flavefaciens]